MPRPPLRTIRLLSGAVLVATMAFAASPAKAADPIRFLTWVRDPVNSDAWHHAWEATDIFHATGSTAYVTIRGEDATATGQLEFIAPVGSVLDVGTYTVNGAAATATNAALRVSGNCWAVGTFVISQAPIVDGSAVVTAFAATFDADCSGERLAGVTAVDPSVPVKAVAVEPADDLALGSSPIGVASTAHDLIVRNIGTATVQLTQANLTGNDPASFTLAHSCTSIDPQTACTIDARLRPAADGNRFAFASIVTDDIGLPRSTRVSGTGTLPDITNSSPASAINITDLPFFHGGHPPADAFGNACGVSGRHTWYRYSTTTKRRVKVDPGFASSPIELFQGTATAMTKLQCGPGGSELEFTALPGVTYWIHAVTQYPTEDRALIAVSVGTADDGVAWQSVRRSPGTFHPYKDGYLDTVSVMGTRNEPASVQLRVYNAADRLVRYLTLASGSGAFVIKWDGKNKAGTVQPSGSYRLRVTAIDAWGNQDSVDLPVSMSKKRLYTYSYTKTLDAGAFRAHGRDGTGRVTRSGSRYAGGVKISSGSNGGAAVAYNFSLPAATIYRSVRFEILGVSVIPSSDVGLQAWTRCAVFDTSCVDRWASGPISYEWRGVRGTATNVSKSRLVRGYVDVSTYGGGNVWADIRDVRLIVSYGVLR